MAKVFITRKMPGRAEELLEAAGHTVVCWPGEMPPSQADLGRELSAAAGAITMVTDPVGQDLFEACPGLKVVSNMAAGYDNVDPEVAAAAGVWLTNTPGVLHETTADLAFALLMSAARQVVASDRDTRAGGWKTWSPTGFLGHDVHGATLGIIGLGEIGTATARRGRGFGMKLLYASRTAKPAVEQELGIERRSLPALLAQSDFVSIHTPLNQETEGLIGARQFHHMKPTGILINTARGGVVDQDALIEALRDGQLAGAALDVTVPEPLPVDHALLQLPNVIITPHIGSASEATRAKMGEMAAENVLAVLRGEAPPNPVNRPASSR